MDFINLNYLEVFLIDEEDLLNKEAILAILDKLDKEILKYLKEDDPYF